ncbi:MAG: hypothetical protein JEZ07_16725 [Phycisphaerae bacterium]|nr:hypothetical protein [Phycisphaerae bacterium]
MAKTNFFRGSFSSQMGFGSGSDNPIGKFIGKTVGFIGLVLAGIGTLSIMFPKVIAYFWAALMYLGALACFQVAFRAWLTTRKTNRDNYVNVEVTDLDDNDNIIDADRLE